MDCKGNFFLKTRKAFKDYNFSLRLISMIKARLNIYLCHYYPIDHKIFIGFAFTKLNVEDVPQGIEVASLCWIALVIA
jgi:hypothetical protein